MDGENKIFKGQAATAAEMEAQNGQPVSNSSPMGEVLPPKGLPPHIKTIVITFDKSNGNLQVAGSIDDKILCYGMMDGAKDVIQEHHMKRQQVSEIKKI